MKYFFALIFIVFLAQFSQAQDFYIVKDNINCTYGIKDSNGDWAVEPNYILIEEYVSGYFRVRDAAGIGVFTPEGKELVPCIHDRIDVSSSNWRIRSQYDGYQRNFQNIDGLYFYGVKENSQLVYNSNGVKIGTFGIHSRFTIDSDKSVIAYDALAKFSTFIDSTGRVFIDSIAGYLAPFKGKNYTFVADNVAPNGYANGNVRVINRKGERMIQFTMDQAMVDTKDRICFNQNKKYGVVSISGDTIIAPKFKRIDAVLSLDQSKAWVIYDDKDRAGIINNSGLVLIEPQYDQVYPIKGIGSENIGWMIENDGRFGIMNPVGNMIIPMNYDQIYPAHFVAKNSRKLTTNYIGRSAGKYYYLNALYPSLSSKAYDSIHPITQHDYSYSKSLTNGIIAKRDGKFGVLNPDGSELTACS